MKHVSSVEFVVLVSGVYSVQKKRQCRSRYRIVSLFIEELNTITTSQEKINEQG